MVLLQGPRRGVFLMREVPLGIVLLEGPRRGVFLMSEVPLKRFQRAFSGP